VPDGLRSDALRASRSFGDEINANAVPRDRQRMAARQTSVPEPAIATVTKRTPTLGGGIGAALRGRRRQTDPGPVPLFR
jgi:hypothetical protein